MSQFFTFIAGPDDQKYYLDAAERKTVMAAGVDPDDADVIAEYSGVSALPPYIEYHYNPFSKLMSVTHHPESDDVNFDRDTHAARAWVSEMDLTALVPGVIIKEAVTLHAYQGRHITARDIELIGLWAEIYKSLDYNCVSIYRAVDQKISELNISAGVIASVRQAVQMRQVYKDPLDAPYYNSSFAADEAYISSFFELVFGNGVNTGGHSNIMWPVIELIESGIKPTYDGHQWFISPSYGLHPRINIPATEESIGRFIAAEGRS